MIKQLKNPMSEEYLELKKIVLSSSFSWYYNKFSTPEMEKTPHVNLPIYSHNFLERPELLDNGFSKPRSEYVSLVSKVLFNILNCNKIKFRTFLRICANLVHPEKEILCSVPHFDHTYEHMNMVVYLTSAGGNTVVENEEFFPKEDDCIMFEGEHYMKTPEKDRRIILVATFI